MSELLVENLVPQYVSEWRAVQQASHAGAGRRALRPSALLRSAFRYGPCVQLAGVEQIDARIQRGMNGGDAFAFVREAVEIRHARAAETYGRDFGAVATKPAHRIAHRLGRIAARTVWFAPLGITAAAKSVSAAIFVARSAGLGASDSRRRDLAVGGQRFLWSRGDTFVAPGWHPIGHHATSDAQLFVLSDEPLLRFSKYYRFEALD